MLFIEWCYVLSEEGTGWNRWVRRWDKMYYRRRDRVEPVGAKMRQNILSEEGTELN